MWAQPGFFSHKYLLKCHMQIEMSNPKQPISLLFVNHQYL